MLERVAHLTEGWANSPWDGCFWAATVPEDVRGGARHVAALEWWGGELELARASRREAPQASPYQRN